MKTRHALIFGLIASSLLIAVPTRAEAGLPAGAFQVARHGADDAPRADRADERRRDGGRASRRQNDDRGYGYGYERRQRSQDDEASAAELRRRDRDQRSDRGEERGNRGGRR